MNLYLFGAAILALILGVVHSILGEILIFRHLSKTSGSADKTSEVLKPRQIRALWSTWHLLTLFGWGLAAVLLYLSNAIPFGGAFLGEMLSGLFCVSAVFWVFGTRGKHPAWIVFLLIAALIWYGNII